MKLPRTLPILMTLAVGAVALLSLSNCEQTTTFVPFIKEICGDKTDNDSDGKLDCDDSDCQVECSVDITISPTSPTSEDSLQISGSSRNAQSISILVTPSPGLSRAAVLESGGGWSAMLYDLKTAQTYAVKAIATSPQGTHDTATTSVERR